MDELDWHVARAALEWQAEMGASDAIGDLPIDRYALPVENLQKNSKIVQVNSTIVLDKTDPIALAKQASTASENLPELQQAMNDFGYCDLQRGARNLVFSDGIPSARVMIFGEAPGREEDLEAKPFVGPEGFLLDKMLSAIGLSRQENTYIATVIPWRPPQDRDPQKLEIDMMTPFARRHVELVSPEVLICMGNTSCVSVLGKHGVNNFRGQWQEGFNLPVLPMVHPRTLLRQPLRKKQAWQDLLELQSWLRSRPSKES